MELGPGFMKGSRQAACEEFSRTHPTLTFLVLVSRDFFFFPSSVTCIQKLSRIMSVLITEFSVTEHTCGTSRPHAPSGLLTPATVSTFITTE